MKCSVCRSDFAVLIQTPSGLCCGWCAKPAVTVPERTQLTIREQFAMAAMTGILSNEAMKPAEGMGYKGYALAAKTMADALIEELAKPHAAHP